MSEAPDGHHDEPLSILRAVAERAGAPVEPEPVDGAEHEPASDDRSADEHDAVDGVAEPAIRSRSGLSPLERLAARTAGADEETADDTDSPSDERSSAGVAARSSPLERLAARSAGDGDTTDAESETSTAAADDDADRERPVGDEVKTSPLERLAARTAGADERSADKSADLRACSAGAESTTGADPVAALKRRLGLEETVEDVKSPLEQLLGQAGTVQVEAALAEHRQREIDERPKERLVPPRLYALEWTRLLLVAAFAGVTAGGGWLVSESLGASGASSDGSIGTAALDVDLARRAFVGAYSVAIALIPLWTYAVMTYARRCGMDHAKPRRHLAMFVFSSLLCVLAFVLDGGVRGGTSALLLIPAALIAGVAGYLVEPARFWFDLPSVTLTIWTVAVPGMLGIAWVGGLLRPVDSLASLQLLAFFTVTVSLIAALITVLIALSASDIEDEIRLSPELAVPLSEVGRGLS